MPEAAASKGTVEREAFRLGEWVLAAAFLAAPMTTLRLGESLTIADTFLAVAAIIALLLLVIRRRLPISSWWIWIGAGILGLSILLVQVFPPDSVEALFESFSGTAYTSSLTTGMRLLMALIVLPMAVSMIVSRWSMVPLLANALVLGVCVSCAFAALDAYVGTSIQTFLSSNPEQVEIFLGRTPSRHVGLTGHPNLFTMTVVIVLPIVIARMTSRRRLLMNLPVCLLLVLGILLSGSRAGLVGIVVLVVLSLALNPRIRSAALSRDPRVLISYAVALAVMMALLFVVPVQSFPLPLPPATTSAQAGDRSAPTLDPGRPPEIPEQPEATAGPLNRNTEVSDEARRQYLEDSVEYIVDRPSLGYGFIWIERSHNIYLQLLISGGILALAGYLLVMFGYFREMLRVRSVVAGRYEDLLVGLAVSLVTYLVVGMVATDLLDRYIYLPVALVLAMSALVGLASPDGDPGNSIKTRGPPLK